MTKRKISAEEALDNLEEEKTPETAPAGLGTPTANQHPVRLSPVTVIGSGIQVPGQQHVTSPLSTPGGMRTNETVVHGPAKTIHFASGQPIRGLDLQQPPSAVSQKEAPSRQSLEGVPKPAEPQPEAPSEEDEEEDEAS